MTGDEMTSPEDARRIARALIGEEPTAEEVARWRRAVELRALPLETLRERTLWAWARRGGPWLGWVDAGLALRDPYSPVRHRLYLMLAVLEASPSHLARFEVKEVGPATALAEIAGRGLAGTLRSTVGIAFVTALRVLAR
ncbi:MAG: hypothetical protein ABIP29_11560 [Candidatus Eisenbacteria bacterium]